MTNKIENSSLISQLAEAQEKGQKVYLYQREGNFHIDASLWGRILRCITTILGLRNYNLPIICGLRLKDKQWKQLPAEENPISLIFESYTKGFKEETDRAIIAKKAHEGALALAFIQQKLHKKTGRDFFIEEQKEFGAIETIFCQLDTLDQKIDQWVQSNPFSEMGTFFCEFDKLHQWAQSNPLESLKEIQEIVIKYKDIEFWKKHLEPYKYVNTLIENFQTDPLEWMPGLYRELWKNSNPPCTKWQKDYVKAYIKKAAFDMKCKMCQEISKRENISSEIDMSDRKKVDQLISEELAWYGSLVKQLEPIKQFEAEYGFLPSPRCPPLPHVYVSNIQYIQSHFEEYFTSPNESAAKKLDETIRRRVSQLPHSLKQMVKNEVKRQTPH